MTAGTALMVDNAQQFCEIVDATARRVGGGQLLIAQTLERAEEVLRQEGIAHVYCDWRLPGNDGAEFLLKLRRRSPGLACTLVTGWQDDLTPELRQRLGSNGIDIVEKDRIDEAWVAAISGGTSVGAHQAPEELESATPEARVGAGPTFEDRASTGERLAIARLERETLRALVAAQSRILGTIAEGLARDLERLPKAGRPVLFGSGGGLSIDELVEHIRTQTPLGLKLIALDREMQKRYGR